MISVFKISLIACILGQVGPAAAQPVPPLSWNDVEDLIASEVEKGFAGSVLLVRDGKIILHEGYGMANREASIANTGETIFALGSTPIDFTLVSLLQLHAKGTIKLDDPITKYFDNMPESKRTITLDHLMRGESGLPDFVHRPGIDADPDHTYISRDEFVQRIREVDLLFEPGAGNEHSHAAWCLLAAVIEVASGQTYESYVRKNILEPAKMTRTGFNGQEFPGENVAIGYGSRSWGEVNTPPQWGKTSWLVMGSGGMVGTVGDLRRFHEAIDSGKLVPEEVLDLYPSRGIYANGDMYGFETIYMYGGDDLFYLNCNSSNFVDGYSLEPFSMGLHRLCTDAPVLNFSIGISFGIDDGALVAVRVHPDTAAQASGIRDGDVLVSANGVAFDLEDPLAAIRDAIENGTVTRIEVLRGGESHSLTLVPRAREP